MRRSSALISMALATCCAATPQGRPLDWPSYNNDAQRTGWEKVDTRITKDNVKDFRLVLKRKLEKSATGTHSLTPPVVIGLLISYRGFKELGFVAGSSGEMWAIDLDVDRIFWQKHYDSGSGSGGSGACGGGGVTAMPALLPPMNFARRPVGLGGPGGPVAPGAGPGMASAMGGPVGGFRPGGPGVAGPGALPAGMPPGAGPNANPTGRGILGAGGFGAPRPTFAISSDGKLHLMNTSTGDDVVEALPFLPADSKATSLTVVDNVVYTTTLPECGKGGVWAMDLSKPEKESAPVTEFALNGGRVARSGGMALGTDGTVYVQTGPGPLDPSSNKWSNTLLALEPKTLKLKEYFSVAGATEMKSGSDLNVTTPVVFEYMGRDVIVSAGSDGRLYLLDSKSLGGDDHRTPLYRTGPVASAGGGIWGGLSSWMDTDGTRWVLAPVWGAVNGGSATNGSIAAFKVEDRDGKTVLTPAWVSRDMISPEAPVITSGVVFALSAGKNSTPAKLYALDATTGKEMYSSGDQVAAPANLTGVTLANGRVLFTTTDGTLYAFGIYMER